jgi:hypothetical protein
LPDPQAVDDLPLQALVNGGARDAACFGDTAKRQRLS